MTNKSNNAGRGRQPGQGRRRQAGFNLLELLVVLVILVVVFAIAFPSFRIVVNSGRVTGPSNELLATMQLARMEAVRRGVRTVLCRTDNPDVAAPACTTAAGNWGGWLAFVDTDGNGAVTAGEPILRVTAMNAPATLAASPAISGASQRITFRPDGLARTAAGALLVGKIRVCMADAALTDNARDVTITMGSRVVVDRATSAVTAGACAAPTDT